MKKILLSFTLLLFNGCSVIKHRIYSKDDEKSSNENCQKMIQIEKEKDRKRIKLSKRIIESSTIEKNEEYYYDNKIARLIKKIDKNR